MNRTLILTGLLLCLALSGCKKEPRFVFVDGGAYHAKSVLLFLGSSIYKKHPWEIKLVEAEPVVIEQLRGQKRVWLIGNVKSFDLSAWLGKELREQDTVILNLDLQGGEQAVLRRMIRQKTVGLVDRLYVKWHPSEEAKGVKELKARMEDAGLWFQGFSFVEAHQERDLVDL